MRIDSVFEEWTTYSLKRSLLPREVDLDLMARRSHSFIVGVTGIRRAGKSSILMNLAKHLKTKGEKVGYINLEDQRLLGSDDLWDRLLSWFGDDEGFLLLDEITTAPGWSGFLARTHELHKDRLHLVVTSSRSGLSIPPKELRGRIMPMEVFPLNFREFMRFNGIEVDATSIGRGRAAAALESYLQWGGFPQVALERDDTERMAILSLVFHNITAMDVAESARYEMAQAETVGRYLPLC
jgi:predicted AAA+ superfamily ATPase